MALLFRSQVLRLLPVCALALLVRSPPPRALLPSGLAPSRFLGPTPHCYVALTAAPSLQLSVDFADAKKKKKKKMKKKQKVDSTANIGHVTHLKTIADKLEFCQSADGEGKESKKACLIDS